MKHTWTVRRHWLAPVNALRRWDRAYQTLLGTRSLPLPPPLGAQPPAVPQQEGPDACRSVCARFDAAPNPHPNY
jgi:hypothetical protein